MPTGVPEPPPEHFAPLLAWWPMIVGAMDPNEKRGPRGDPVLGYVSDEDLEYWIDFENVGSAPAQRVQITDRLGEALDPYTVRLREISLWNQESFSADFFGTLRETGYNWPEEGFHLCVHERVAFPSPVDPARTLLLDIDVVIDADQNTITWTFQTLDPGRIHPDTGEMLPPECVLEGFLPQAGSGGASGGSVGFTVRVRQPLSEDFHCRNDAVILFDGRKEIATRTWSNPYTGFPAPEIPSHPSPPSGDDSLAPDDTCLGWQASPYGSIRYDLYLWKEGQAEPASPTADDIAENGYCPGLLPDTAYLWRVKAKNARVNPGPGDVAEGPVWQFKTLPLPPGKPGNLRCENEQTPRPTFMWDAAENAEWYALDLVPKGGAWPLRPAHTVPVIEGTSYTPPEDLDPSVACRQWRVIAMNARAPYGNAASTSTTKYCGECQPRFRRGDVNDDGARNIADAIFLLSHLFAGGPEPTCKKAADANDDGALNIADAITILSHLFAGTGPLPAPFPDCGEDPTEDELTCEVYENCNT